jgi:hypothetical protein
MKLGEQKLLLADIVQISQQYQRSIRIDTDIGSIDALSGYICHRSATGILGSMCKYLASTNQRCFTWTGPFGGGKSSLAVSLASALHSDKTVRKKARDVLRLNATPEFDQVFPVRSGWLIISLVGRRGSIVADLHSALRRAQQKKIDGRSRPTQKSLIADLLREAAEKSSDGVLVLLDELGKFLEAAALGLGDDVYFFQELAEAAARSKGRLVVVGILHQSFAQYSNRLGVEARDDWAKIQGRYLDLPFVAASDEVVELIGQAIETEKKPTWVSSVSISVAEQVRSRRPAVGDTYVQALRKCWPLHPAMAALLGPISKRQFGQNERSTFSFLSSLEPYGFRSYLNSTDATELACYRPSDYWDYLKANLEPVLLASPDGHRWSQAAEAVERTERQTGDPFLVTLIKNIALITFFRSGSGLAANQAVLRSIFFDRSAKELDLALQELSKLKVILFRSFIGAWSVFEGSDFDLGAAVVAAQATSAAVDYQKLAQALGYHSVVAKRHYHKFGSMRWMDLALCSLEQAQTEASNFQPKRGEFGLLILVIPPKNMNSERAEAIARSTAMIRPWPVLLSIPRNHALISDLACELVALESVKERHELAGDSVARREVYARLAGVRAELEEQIQEATNGARWYAGDQDPIQTGGRLPSLASDLADALFYQAPPVWSELINRDNLSTSSVKARRALLRAMLVAEEKETLGFEGFPAERGLYETVHRRTELHRRTTAGTWQFMPPTEQSSQGFRAIWEVSRSQFGNSGRLVRADEMYSIWAAPPFGLKAGLLPVFLATFLLAHKANIAVYKDGLFVPSVTDFEMDELLQDPTRFSMRWITLDREKEQLLQGISLLMNEVGESEGAGDPLQAARSLVSLVFKLPAWVRRTTKLESQTKAVLDTLLKASDPHKVLFVDLVSLLQASSAQTYTAALRGPIVELTSAYGRMLAGVEAFMLKVLDASKDDLGSLRERAQSVCGVSGDLKLDGFATRLAHFDGSRDSIEGLLSLAAEKPPRDWVDRHIDSATLELAQLARRFREAELYVSIQGRKTQTEAISILIGAGLEGKTLTRTFSISSRNRATVERKAEEVVSNLTEIGLEPDVAIAILAKAAMKLVEE